MPFLRNQKYEAFAQAYVSGLTAGSPGRSYLAAGYRCTTESARVAASRLLKNDQVMRRIAELRQDMEAKEARSSEQAIARLAITKEAVLSELARIAFANILDYGQPDDDGGFTFDFSAIDRDKGAAIQEIIVTPMSGTGEGGRPAMRIRVKLAPKRDALVDLGKHFGLFVDRRQGRQAEDDYAGLSEEELEARIRIIVGELQRMGIDVASMFGIAEGGPGGKPPTRTH